MEKNLKFGDRGICKRIEDSQGEPQENHKTKSHSIQVVSVPRLHIDFSTRKDDDVSLKCEVWQLEQRSGLTQSLLC